MKKYCRWLQPTGKGKKQFGFSQNRLLKAINLADNSNRYICYMDINLHILLVSPPAGIDYAIQKGSGSNYEPIQIQRANSGDLEFELTIPLKADAIKANPPRFTGPFAQGKPLEQFFYIDIGTYASQANFHGGRIKVPLHPITWDLLEGLNGGALTTTIQGMGKNGDPVYATPKPFAGWKVKE